MSINAILKSLETNIHVIHDEAIASLGVKGRTLFANPA